MEGQVLILQPSNEGLTLFVIFFLFASLSVWWISSIGRASSECRWRARLSNLLRLRSSKDLASSSSSCSIFNLLFLFSPYFLALINVSNNNNNREGMGLPLWWALPWLHYKYANLQTSLIIIIIIVYILVDLTRHASFKCFDGCRVQHCVHTMMQYLRMRIS